MEQKVQLFKINDTVEGCFIPSSQFKTKQISVTFYLPTEEEKAAAFALLPMLLSNGCDRFKKPLLLSRELNRLYGATVSADSDRVGDALAIRFVISHVAERCVGDNIGEQCRELLCDMIFSPALDGDAFDKSNFERELRLQLENIDALINDKRSYARDRCMVEMCKGEPVGVPLYGSREATAALTAEQVCAAWKEMLCRGYVRIGIASDEFDRAEFDEIAARLSALPRENAKKPDCFSYTPHSGEINEVRDVMKVNQGKLVMGFKTPLYGSDKDTYVLSVFADLFGGGPYSRLFSNVREKMSLCYYCSCRALKKNGILFVDSGVEFENMQKTRDAVLEQLEIMRRGEFDGESLSASKLSLTQALRSMSDSQTAQDRWYSSRLFDDEIFSPEQMSALINSVTADDIVNAAKSVTLDTVYCLCGEEKEA